MQNLNISKIKEKRVSRLYAVQALFQMEIGNNSVQKVQFEFENHRDLENRNKNYYSKAD